MLEMSCDKCDEIVDEDFNGACRLKLGRKELIFHLCASDQRALKEALDAFLEAHPAKLARGSSVEAGQA